jgi:hypothetical protein
MIVSFSPFSYSCFTITSLLPPWGKVTTSLPAGYAEISQMRGKGDAEMTHMNEHGLTSMANDRIGGFHKEATARQIARQTLVGRNRFGPMGVLVRVPGTLAVQYIERPVRQAAFNVTVRFFAWVSRMTGVEQGTSPFESP